jgi:hypothetical protein
MPRSTSVRQISRTYPNGSRIAVLAVLLALSPACGRAARDDAIDLLHELPQAERHAVPSTIDEAVRADSMVIGPGEPRRPVLITEAPARVIWSLRLPRQGRLRTSLALVPDARGAIGPGVTVRIGISDGRLYEQLTRFAVAAPASGVVTWQPLEVDLSGYAGWQWSLFYRPSEILWRLAFSVDATPGGTLAWAAPVIEGRK